MLRRFLNNLKYNWFLKKCFFEKIVTDIFMLRHTESLHILEEVYITRTLYYKFIITKFILQELLNIFTKFIGINLSWSVLCNFIKKWLQRRCFPVNFTKFSTTPILLNICERLLLNVFDIIKFLPYPCSIKIW